MLSNHGGVRLGLRLLALPQKTLRLNRCFADRRFPRRMALGRDATATKTNRQVTRVLFLCLFAAQAGSIALTPMLTEVARDFDVSTATAGQLRTVAGLVAAATALLRARLNGGASLRQQLVSASLLLAVGSVASAAAPALTVLAAAQVLVGAGIGILTTAATLAAAEWVAPERRVGTLAGALIGQPTAWIVGMPILGAVGETSWRWGWALLPLPAALVAAAALANGRNRDPRPAPATKRAMAAPTRRLGRWLVAEALANTAWAGTLVYAGALFVETYGASSETTGIALALGASAYVAGNVAGRRIAGGERRRLLLFLGIALAGATTLFGAFRPSLVMSTALFAMAAFAAGARTIVSGAIAVAAPPELRPVAMASRAASIQGGYFFGSLAGGVALALGGYVALGATLGTIFLVAGVVAAPGRTSPRRRVRAAPRRSLDAATAQT
jgi:MFS transporter, DHA1 family, inner membrane transport protein